MRFSLLVLLVLVSLSVKAQLVINEISNGTSGSEEYVELLVVGTPGCNTCVDLRGWVLDDNGGDFAPGSGSGIASGHMVFANDPQWACVGVGTIILVYNNGDPNASIPPDDPTDANGDCVYVIGAASNLFQRNNSIPSSGSGPTYSGPYIAGGNWSTTSLNNNGDACQTRDPSTLTSPYHAVSYGNNNQNTIIYFSGSGANNVYYMEHSVNDDFFLQSNWASGSAISQQTPGAPNNAANANYIASLNNNCNPLPPVTLTVSNDTAICAGDSVRLFASSTVPGTYTWSNGSTDSLITVGPTSTTIYTLVFDDGTCQSNAFVEVTVSSSPTASIVGDTTICEGESTLLAAPSGFSYQWSNGGSNNFINPSPAITTPFSVIVTNGAGCSDTASVTIVVDPAPQPIISGDTVICLGQTANLSAQAGFNSYDWSTGSSSANISVSPVVNTVYSVTVEGSNGCEGSTSQLVQVANFSAQGIPDTGACQGNFVTLTAIPGFTYSWNTGDTTQSVSVQPSAQPYVVDLDNGVCSGSDTVFVNAYPTVNASILGDTSLCQGESTLLIGTGGSSYFWNTGDTLAAINVSPSSSITYSLTVINAQGCSDTVDANISVNPEPQPVITGDSVICPGASSTLTASAGFSSYSWSTGSNNQSINVSPSSASTYSVTVTDTFGCIGDTTCSVSVPPLNGLILGDTSICLGDTANLFVSGSVLGVLWSTGDTTANIGLSPLTTTSYSVTVTYFGACTEVLNVTIDVTSGSIVASANITDASCGIDDGEITVTASGGNGTLTYTLLQGGVPIATQTNPIFSGLAFGTYDIEVSDPNGCAPTVTLSSLSVGISGSLTATEISSGPSCNGFSDGIITIDVPVNAVVFSLNGGTPQPSGVFDSLPAGSYTIIADAVGLGCSDTLMVSLSDPPVLSINAIPDTATIQQGESITMSSVVNGGTSPYNYNWSPNSFLDCDSCAIVAASPLANEIYILTLTDANGCTQYDTVEISVIIKEPFWVQMPNAFTPNGDGLNDYLRPKGNEPFTFKLSVWNRWGEIIYESEDAQGWDGFYREEAQDLGVYVFRLEYVSLLTGERGVLSGNVTLLR